jgi:hypothetical protein
MLQNVLSTLPPLALHNEPADCVDAFQEFTFSLIKEQNFKIDSEEKAQVQIQRIYYCIITDTSF